MKALLTIIILVSFSTVYSQTNCLAIIDLKYPGPVDIYDNPEGEIIYRMKNDSINEDFLQLSILDQTDNYFYVSISTTIKKDQVTGWIRKAAYIGAYKRHEKFPMDLILYKDKKVSDAEKMVISNWTPMLLTIDSCDGGWVLVLLKQNGEIFRGWIEENELCANFYTYCN